MSQSTALQGQEILRLARGWIGTPYQHQAACRGAGCDCLGLLRGVWQELYGTRPATPPAYTPDWDEATGQERLWQAARQHLIPRPLTHAAPGDVLLFRMRPGRVAKHLGLQAQVCAGETCLGGGSFIHAYSGHGVVESTLTPFWQGRIVARFAFPVVPGPATEETA